MVICALGFNLQLSWFVYDLYMNIETQLNIRAPCFRSGQQNTNFDLWYALLITIRKES